MQFKSAGVTISNPAYHAKIGQPQGAKLVLIGKPVYTYPVAGTTFAASLSARMQFANGSQTPINWKAKGSFATCGGGVTGKPKYFPTGIQCFWVVPFSARGRSVTFVMTLHVAGQVQSTQFTARVH